MMKVVVWVKDTGTGIDSQIFPRLFSKFATKSEVGGTDYDCSFLKVLFRRMEAGYGLRTILRAGREPLFTLAYH